MKIPITTDEKPYIEFRINKKGKIKLSTTSSWWGGKSGGFSCSDGAEGNTCKPQQLNSYIKAFKNKKIKAIKKEILSLQKALKALEETK